MKRLLLTGLLALILGGSTLQAQQTTTTSTPKRTPNKFAVAFQMPYNGNKLGAGLRFSYDFTDLLRFSVDADGYFYTVKGGFIGRVMDLNPNLNFIFGNGDFHFYLIAGAYFTMGHSIFLEVVTNSMGFGLGLNAGFGMEYQITESIRVFLEQQASLGLISSWMPKVGCAYCF